jgi:hypothetical protein
LIDAAVFWVLFPIVLVMRLHALAFCPSAIDTARVLDAAAGFGDGAAQQGEALQRVLSEVAAGSLDINAWAAQCPQLHYSRTVLALTSILCFFRFLANCASRRSGDRDGRLSLTRGGARATAAARAEQKSQPAAERQRAPHRSHDASARTSRAPHLHVRASLRRALRTRSLVAVAIPCRRASAQTASRASSASSSTSSARWSPTSSTLCRSSQSSCADLRLRLEGSRRRGSCGWRRTRTRRSCCRSG